MRVLLLENDKRNARFLQKVLKENAYAVDFVSNGEDALYQIEIHDYDLVILEAAVSGEIDGYKVCEEIRANENTVPILILSNRNSLEDKIRGLDLGADDYLTKPFEFPELLARLRALLRRQQGDFFPTVLNVGELTIDTRSQTAKAKGTPITLTTKEYSMLRYFARNVNRVIGREELSEHIWNENFDSFSNLIEVYVNRLRQKINDAVESPVLRTRRGAGYILEAPEEENPAENKN